MSDSSHSLPKLEHIPTLDGSVNAHEWFRAMTQVLKAEGVWGHVEGIDNDLSAVWQASYPPPLTAASTNPQRQASMNWWIKDSRAVAIIDSRLNPISKTLLPMGDNVTARTIWTKLKNLYNRVDLHAQFELRDRLTANVLRDASDYMRFLGEFDTCRSRLAAMGAPLSELETIHTLLRQIPNSGSWPTFKQSIQHFVQTWSEFDAQRDPLAPTPPNTLYSKVVARLEQECLAIQSSDKPGPGSEYVNFTSSSGAKKSSKNPQGITCSNCNLENHDFKHCWRAGGGAAGQWPGGPKDPSKNTKLTSTSSASSSTAKADLVAAVLPLTSSTVIADPSSYPEEYDLSC